MRIIIFAFIIALLAVNFPIATSLIMHENGKDTTFALYTDGDKYKNILETVNFPLYVGR